MMRASAITLAAFLTLSTAAAHEGVVHRTIEEAQAHQTERPPENTAPSGVPFPLDLGGSFQLTDHNGHPRTERDPAGKPQLLFFGYANCEAICSVALPLMAKVVSDLEQQGLDVQPLMVTVDPERDTVEALGPALAKHHHKFIGLTGTDAELQHIYHLFGIEKTVVYEHPELGPIYAHGSHMYLLDAEGAFLTLLPPILSAERVAELVAAYAQPAG